MLITIITLPIRTVNHYLSLIRDGWWSHSKVPWLNEPPPFCSYSNESLTKSFTLLFGIHEYEWGPSKTFGFLFAAGPLSDRVKFFLPSTGPSLSKQVVWTQRNKEKLIFRNIPNFKEIVREGFFARGELTTTTQLLHVFNIAKCKTQKGVTCHLNKPVFCSGWLPLP